LFIVNLTTDSAGAPGTSIESWSTPSASVYPSSNFDSIQLTSVSNALLFTGSQYWLEISPGAPNTEGIWNRSTSGPALTLFSSGSGWTCCVNAVAFDVIGAGTGVPEPGTLALVQFSLLGLAAYSFRAHRKFSSAAQERGMPQGPEAPSH